LASLIDPNIQAKIFSAMSCGSAITWGSMTLGLVSVGLANWMHHTPKSNPLA
jgi:hypothetical protein